MQPLRSVVEAARLLGISPWTIRGYIRDGKLRPVRLGRRVLMEEAELERFVAQCQNPIKVQAATNAATNNTEEASL
jgi:excisionase family DNA binding protein